MASAMCVLPSSLFGSRFLHDDFSYIPYRTIRAGFHSLPEDLLLRIFSFLAPLPDLLIISGVSRYWRRLLRENLYLADECREVTLKRVPKSPAAQLAFLQVLPYARKLRILNIEHFDEAAPFFSMLLGIVSECCPSLDTLKVSNSNSMDAAAIAHLVERSRTMTNVQLIGCPTLSDRDVFSVMRAGRRKLKKVDVSHCVNLVGAFVNFAMPSASVVSICDTPALDGAAVMRLAQNFPQVTHLDLSGCYFGITDESVGVIARCCALLTALKLACPNREDAAQTDLLRTDGALMRLACYGRNLVDLDIEGWVNVTDWGLSAIASRLERLVASGCEKLTVSSVSIIIARSQMMKKLDVSRCPSISPSGMTEVAAAIAPILEKGRVVRLWNVGASGNDKAANGLTELLGSHLFSAWKMDVKFGNPSSKPYGFGAEQDL